MRTLVCGFIRTTNNMGTAGRNYNYLYTGGRDIRVGDWAIVHNGSEFVIVQIKRIKPGIDDRVEKHVLAVITAGDFQQYLEANRNIDEHRRVFDQLDYLLEEDRKLDKYKDLAERNAEAAALLQKARFWSGPVIDSLIERPFSMDDGKTPAVAEELAPAPPAPSR